MKQQDLVYITETKKRFNEACIDVLKSIEQKGWALFQIYDVKERLAAKGFQHENLKIIEICSAKHSSSLLQKNKLTSLCMPCKINVMEEKGRVKIVAMNPSIMAEFFPEVSKQELGEVEKDIKEIIDNAVNRDR